MNPTDAWTSPSALRRERAVLITVAIVAAGAFAFLTAIGLC